MTRCETCAKPTEGRWCGDDCERLWLKTDAELHAGEIDAKRGHHRLDNFGAIDNYHLRHPEAEQRRAYRVRKKKKLLARAMAGERKPELMAEFKISRTTFERWIKQAREAA